MLDGMYFKANDSYEVAQKNYLYNITVFHSIMSLEVFDTVQLLAFFDLYHKHCAKIFI